MSSEMAAYISEKVGGAPITYPAICRETPGN